MQCGTGDGDVGALTTNISRNPLIFRLIYRCGCPNLRMAHKSLKPISRIKTFSMVGERNKPRRYGEQNLTDKDR